MRTQRPVKKPVSVARSPYRQLLKPIILLIGIFVAGTTGYYILGSGLWSWADCAYMTAITLSTVGFHEVLPVSQDGLLRLYTMGLIFVGAGTIVYLLSNITAFLLEGQLNELIRRHRMDKTIEKMRDHYLVCGIGRNGEYAAELMARGDHPMVVVDSDEATIKQLQESHDLDLLYVVGDANDEHVLLRAGVQRAQGLIAALPKDQDNLFLILTARDLNPGIRVVAKVNEQRSRKKFLQVGANDVVSPSAMGGYRMFLEMVRPEVTDFVDFMLLENEDLRIDEVPISRGSPLVGKRLSESDIRRRTNVLIVGVRDEEGARFTYNPGPDFQLQEDMTMIALGPREAVTRLREMAGDLSSDG